VLEVNSLLLTSGELQVDSAQKLVGFDIVCYSLLESFPLGNDKGLVLDCVLDELYLKGVARANAVLVTRTYQVDFNYVFKAE